MFEAFINPDITTKFWFTKSSGRLEVGKQVQWEWEMYGVSIPVTATAIEPNARIAIEWPGYSGPTTVEWTFAPQPNDATFVSITEAGFIGDGDALVKQVADSTQGFTLVLAGLKALLEHNIRLKLVADRFPKKIDDKQSVLLALREEYDRWEALLASLSEAQITAHQLDDGWSIKDMVAHLHAWQQRSNARLEAAQLNQEPAYPAWPEPLDPETEDQLQDLNTWLYETYRDQPWSSVHLAWREGFLRLLDLGEALPEADLLAVDKYAWLEGYALIAVLQGTYGHHQEHMEFLEPVLARLQQP